MNDTDLQIFKRTYGTPGATERRAVALERGTVKNSGDGSGRLKVVGHASVFNSPSVEMTSRYGSFIERIAPGAFDAVLAKDPDVLLTWDHSTLYPLARTSAGTLELSTNTHGLRFFASCTPTSYAEDLRNLMTDGIVNEASFMFTVAPGGETWEERDGRVLRTITQIGDLYDCCLCCAGAYPATDSSIARKLFVQYAIERKLLRTDPDARLRTAKLRAELELRRRRLSV